MSRELPEVCKLVKPEFLNWLKEHIEQRKRKMGIASGMFTPGMASVNELATACGYELVEGKYIQFPKRAEAIDRVCQIYTPGGKGKMGHCEIVEEHGDGDLTVKTEDNIFVITTDGRVFREIQPLDR